MWKIIPIKGSAKPVQNKDNTSHDREVLFLPEDRLAAKFLTKSLFKLGRECPAKLYYTQNKQYFDNQHLSDPFLEALAEGGFQVGELAKSYHPEGIEIEETEHQAALEKTEELIYQEQITLFEAALAFNGCFARIDILKKNGSHIEIIEVKSKSFNPHKNPGGFLNQAKLKKNIHQIRKEWKPYLEDLCFQTYIAKGCFPNARISSKLMLADKSKKASINGLNQLFSLDKKPPHKHKNPYKEKPYIELGDPVLTAFDANTAIASLLKATDPTSQDTFCEEVEKLKLIYLSNNRPITPIGSHCQQCEFKSHQEPEKSGFHHCWSDALDMDKSHIKGPYTFELWNFRESDSLIKAGIWQLSQINPASIPASKDRDSGLSKHRRQQLQIEYSQNDAPQSAYIDKNYLLQEKKNWYFPLHFIDFETSMVAIPFHKGKPPYEQIAFQFSHHQIDQNGRISHQDQFIHTKAGEFPNFEFVRALKKSLKNDRGTIFRYSHHENTVLCQIYNQLKHSKEPDAEELCTWIKTITHTQQEGLKWRGDRDMVDLCEVLTRAYYHPLTGGSNSIKKILPAILSDSKTLAQKYSKPIYGKNHLVKSLNFENMTWMQADEAGTWKDPYSLLAPLSKDLDQINQHSTDDHLVIKNGGAAMMAYAKMQFTHMSIKQRENLKKSLLRYCELDTFAMVLIYEYLCEVLSCNP